MLNPLEIGVPEPTRTSCLLRTVHKEHENISVLSVTGLPKAKQCMYLDKHLLAVDSSNVARHSVKQR
jgi:hypothetical protein